MSVKNPWQQLGSQLIYENPWISVREDSVIRPDGVNGIYGVVNYKNKAIGILPVDTDENGIEHLYLVGQYRYPIGFYSWEIPEGGCPIEEEPLEAARRELMEETGLQASTWQLLGTAYLSNSVSDELALWYLATDLTCGEPSPEGTEELVTTKVSFEKALNMVTKGEINDALSVLAINSYALSKISTRSNFSLDDG